MDLQGDFNYQTFILCNYALLLCLIDFIVLGLLERFFLVFIIKVYKRLWERLLLDSFFRNLWKLGRSLTEMPYYLFWKELGVSGVKTCLKGGCV